MQQIKKLAKKLNLKEEAIYKIISYDHIIDNFCSKKTIKQIDVDLSVDLEKEVLKIAKALKVSRGAVVASLLIQYLEESP